MQIRRSDTVLCSIMTPRNYVEGPERLSLKEFAQFAHDDTSPMVKGRYSVFPISPTICTDESSIENYIRSRISKCFNPFAKDSSKCVITPRSDVVRLKALLESAENKPSLQKCRNKSQINTKGSLPRTKPTGPAFTFSPVASTRSLKRNLDDDYEDKGCLKITLGKREVTYENARRYFYFRSKKYPDQRAIPMANRIRCGSSASEREGSAYQTYQKKIVAKALDRKVREAVLKVKKEHLARMHTQYIEEYKDKKKELVEKISVIYNSEIAGLNNRPQSMPSSPKKEPGVYYRKMERKIKERPKYRDFTKEEGSITEEIKVRNSEGKLENPWDKFQRSRAVIKIAAASNSRAVEMDKKITEKIKNANRVREMLLENKKRRVHINHKERLMDIEKQQDEVRRNIEFLSLTKAAQREQQIDKAIEKKFGKIRKKIYY